MYKLTSYNYQYSSTARSGLTPAGLNCSSTNTHFLSCVWLEIKACLFEHFKVLKPQLSDSLLFSFCFLLLNLFMQIQVMGKMLEENKNSFHKKNSMKWILSVHHSVLLCKSVICLFCKFLTFLLGSIQGNHGSPWSTPSQGDGTCFLVSTSWLVYSCIEHKVAFLHVLMECMTFYFCQVDTDYALIILLLVQKVYLILWHCSDFS